MLRKTGRYPNAQKKNRLLVEHTVVTVILYLYMYCMPRKTSHFLDLLIHGYGVLRYH